MRKLPEARALGDLLGDLLGRQSMVKAGPLLPLTPRGLVVVSQYASDAGELSAACLTDLRFACSAGASLTMIPAGVASSSAASGRLPANLEENLREVMNILAQLFNEGGPPHVVLKGVAVLTPPLPEPVAALARLQRVDYDVVIEGYGPGAVSFVG